MHTITFLGNERILGHTPDIPTQDIVYDGLICGPPVINPDCFWIPVLVAASEQSVTNTPWYGLVSIRDVIDYDTAALQRWIERLG